MRKQIGHSLEVGLKVLPGSRPADNAKLVIVALTLGVRTMLDKQMDDRNAILFDRQVQRVGVLTLAANVRISTTASAVALAASSVLTSHCSLDQDANPYSLAITNCASESATAARTPVLPAVFPNADQILLLKWWQNQ